jgi:hypothetical protein
MAVRIPQYEDRLTPSGGFVTARAQGAEVSPALGRAMENLGEAGMRFASVNMAIQKREKEKQEAEFLQQEQERLRKQEAKEQADAITEGGKQVSDATVAFQGWYNEASKNPGPNFAAQVNQKWAEVTKSVLDGDSTEEERIAQAQAGMEPYFGIRNEAARQNAQRSLTQLGQHYSLNALQIEAKAGVVKRLDNLESTVSNNERVVGADPSLYNTLRTSTLSDIQNDPTLDVETKLRTARAASERLTVAALQGAIARGESDRVKLAIMNRLGSTALSEDEIQSINATGNRLPANNQAVQAGPDLRTVQGLVTPGNIDLTNRPRVQNKDGSISTVSSFSVNVDGKEVLLTPIADDGKVLSQQQAIDKYKKDGKHLGIFETPAAASAYGKQLSADQERFYSNKQGNVKVTPLPPNVARWSTSVQKQASENGVDPNVMLWQIKVESGGNPAAINEDDRKRTGDPSIGLSQFQPKTAAAYGIDPKDPEQAIKGQALYMRDLLKMFGGDYQKALAGYNWGQGNVQKAIAKHGDNWLQKSPEKVQNYVNSILTNAGRSGGGNTVSGQVSSAVSNQQQANAVVANRAVDPTMMEIVSRLPQDKLISTLHSAQTSINQQQSMYQSSIKATETDHLAAFGNGEQVAKPLTLAQYQQAYGQAEGSQRFGEYQKVQRLGYEINSVRTMNIDQQRQVLESYNPVPGSPGYALAMQRKQVLAQAIDQVNKSREADPMAYEMSVVKMNNIKPIDWNKLPEVFVELGNRVGVAYTNNKNYGSPLTLLTKQEATNLAAGMNGMSAQEKLKYLSMIRSSVKDQVAYRSVLQQIAPDSVVTSMAGMIINKEGSVTISKTFGADESYKPQQVAQLMLEGEAILNPTKTAAGQDGRGGKFPTPKESDFMLEFNNQVGNAFAGNPGAASSAMQGVKSYYIGKAARDGDLSDLMNSKRMQESINAVIGGVSDVNGSKVIRPWGMPEDIFKDRAKIAFDATIKSKNMTASYGGVTLQNYGDGTYLIRSGTDFLRGPDGAPVIIDVVSPAASNPVDAATISSNPGQLREPGSGKLKTK